MYHKLKSLNFLPIKSSTAYLMPRQALSPTRGSHHKIHICHQFIIEHHRIPKELKWLKLTLLTIKKNPPPPSIYYVLYLCSTESASNEPQVLPHLSRMEP